MDDETKIKYLKERINAFVDARDWDQFHNAKELAVALSIEASELLEHFRWKTSEQSDKLFDDPKKKEEISDEMADVMYFILRLSHRYDIDLSESVMRKIRKNEEKYPVDKFKGSIKKYNEK